MSDESAKKSKGFASFDEFNVALDQAIQTTRQRRRQVGLLPLLKRKVTFALSDTQIKETFEKIRQSPGFDTIELVILMESRLSPSPSQIIAGLGSEILRQYISDTNFSDCMRDGGSSSSVRRWIAQLPSAEEGSQNERRPIGDRTLRAAFGCLLLFLEREFFFESILYLLTVYLGSKHLRGIKKFKEKRAQAFAMVIGDLVKRSRPKKPQMKLLLYATMVLEEQLQRFTEALRRQTHEFVSLEISYREKTEELAARKRDAVQRAEKISQLEGRVRQLEVQLQEEVERAAAIEQHWKEVLQQELAGLSFKLRSQLEHEVEEIQLCLQGDNPSPGMALHRIKRIGEIIAHAGRQP